jgi:hypothetical protein
LRARRGRDDGVDELHQGKLTPLLRLKYHDSIADAVAELGRPEDIGNAASRSLAAKTPAHTVNNGAVVAKRNAAIRVAL